MKIARSFLVVLVLAVLVLSACSKLGTDISMKKKGAAKMPDASGDGDVLTFGVMMPLTGGGAEYGIPLQQAIELAVEEINAEGGISGKQIELITEDSKCDPKEGATVAEKLVNVDGVKVIFGGACSGETLGAAPITEEGQVILISPSATSPKVTDAGDYVFRLAPSDLGAGETAAKFAYNARKYKKIAVISETTDYAQGLREVFTKKFTELGGEIVADETFATDASDFRTIALKVQPKQPDALYIVPQTPDKGILLLKQLRQAGVIKPILTAEVLIGRSIVKANPDLTEGMVGFEQVFNDKVGKSMMFVNAFWTAYKEEISFPFQAGAYDSVYLIKEAIEANDGELDTDFIKEYLYSVKGWDGAVGKLTLDSNGDAILSYSIKKVENGQVVDAGTIRSTSEPAPVVQAIVTKPAATVEMNETVSMNQTSETNMTLVNETSEEEANATS